MGREKMVYTEEELIQLHSRDKEWVGYGKWCYAQGVKAAVKRYNDRIWAEVEAPLNTEQLRQINSIAWEIAAEQDCRRPVL